MLAVVILFCYSPFRVDTRYTREMSPLMEIVVAGLRTLLPILAWTILVPGISGQGPGQAKDKTAPPARGAIEEQPTAKMDAATIRQLMEDLKSGDFKKREKATRELSRLPEVPDALRQAIKSADLETRRRAQTIVDSITTRLEEKEFQALVADLQKVEVDRFIHRMVTDKKFNGEKQWRVIETLARAVTKQANALSGRTFAVPDFDFKALLLQEQKNQPWLAGRILFDHVTENPAYVNGSVLLSTGSTPYITSVSDSIVIVDGDFGGATSITNSLVIVRGNVGRCTGVRNSIILATGNFIGATRCDDSFFQVNNQRIRFTLSQGSVFVKTIMKATRATNSQILDTD